MEIHLGQVTAFTQFCYMALHWEAKEKRASEVLRTHRQTLKFSFILLRSPPAGLVGNFSRNPSNFYLLGNMQ